MLEPANSRVRKVKSILITQESPSDTNNPYIKLAEKYNIKIDFRPFIQVEPVDLKEWRKQKVDILQHTAVILTSRNAVDHFFHLCKELRIEMQPDMKYFCLSEQTANYLNKYIVIRKRKIFHGKKTTAEFMDCFKKHKAEKFLFACSDIRKNDIPDHLKANGFQFTEAIIHRTAPSDLSDLKNVFYDVIAFFSPMGINSLFSNFQDFKQNNTRIATIGPATAAAAREAGLILDIEAPLPSMTDALELYVKKANGIK